MWTHHQYLRGVTPLLPLLLAVAVLASCAPQANSAALNRQQQQQQEGAAAGGGHRNVLGAPLEPCCTDPITGYFRDGYCRTDASDHGRHVVCAQVTQEFLEYSRSQGNDLITPAPQYRFPGLVPGDRWCLCALRWREALLAGKAPKVFLGSTHAKALEMVGLGELSSHAVVTGAGAAQGGAAEGGSGSGDRDTCAVVKH